MGADVARVDDSESGTERRTPPKGKISSTATTTDADVQVNAAAARRRGTMPQAPCSLAVEGDAAGRGGGGGPRSEADATALQRLAVMILMRNGLALRSCRERRGALHIDVVRDEPE